MQGRQLGAAAAQGPRRFNIVMLRDSPDRFCTAATACASPGPGGTRMSFALAGHHAALLFPAHGEPSILPGQGGPVLGVVPRIAAPVHDVLLAPGDIVVLHTDGLLDAHAPARQLQQEDVLQAAAGVHDADALLDRLLEFAAEGGGEPRDDIALLAVQAV